MENPKIKFEQITERFIDELTRLDYNYKLHYYLQGKKFDSIGHLNFAPAFFGNIIQTLLDYLIVGTARIYENYNGRKRSDNNLVTYLNYIQENLEIFPDKNVQLNVNNANEVADINLVQKHKELINKNKDVLDNLFTWRDKHYAHFDEKYFMDSERLRLDAELTYRNIRELIELASKIVNSYTVAYNGKYHSTTVLNYNDVEKIFRLIDNQLNK